MSDQPGRGDRQRHRIEQQLVTVLERTALMQDPANRQTVLHQLRRELGSPLPLPERSQLRLQLVELVATCTRVPGGVSAMIDVVCYLEPHTREASQLSQLRDEWEAAEVVGDEMIGDEEGPHRDQPRPVAGRSGGEPHPTRSRLVDQAVRGGAGPIGVVFVHGFWSSPATWERFLQLIRQDADLAGFTCHPFGYASPRLRLHLLRRIPDLDDVADNLRMFLAHQVRDHRLVLVSHSQGGLVVQRFLAHTLAEGRGPELARIRKVVMFACPNAGSELALGLRRRAWLRPHPQEQALRPLDRDVVRAKRVVLNRVVHATGVSADRCHIPVVAYAADADGVVPPSSARDTFPDAGVLPGDHFSVIKPDSPTHRSYVALKHDLLEVAAGTR